MALVRGVFSSLSGSSCDVPRLLVNLVLVPIFSMGSMQIGYKLLLGRGCQSLGSYTRLSVSIAVLLLLSCHSFFYGSLFYVHFQARMLRLEVGEEYVEYVYGFCLWLGSVSFLQLKMLLFLSCH